MSEVIIPKKINEDWFTVLIEDGESDAIISSAITELDANEKAKKENIKNGLEVPQSVEDYLIQNKKDLAKYMAYRAKYP